SAVRVFLGIWAMVFLVLAAFCAFLTLRRAACRCLVVAITSIYPVDADTRGCRSAAGGRIGAAEVPATAANALQPRGGPCRRRVDLLGYVHACPCRQPTEGRHRARRSDPGRMGGEGLQPRRRRRRCRRRAVRALRAAR